MGKAFKLVSESCFHYTGIRKSPYTAGEQTSYPQVVIGASFAADVMRRESKFILVVRESVTSYTSAIITDNERAENFSGGLCLCVELLPFDDSIAAVRTDTVPGFHALIDDMRLKNTAL